MVLARPGCASCGADMDGKRPHAVYCSRNCKTRASERRRTADGRNRERDHARYLAEAPARRAYAKRYFYAHRERVRELKWRRKAIRAGVRVFEFTARDWARLVARYRGACAYCGQPGELQPDHVTPISRGGVHGPGNILPSCAPCNTQKRTRYLVEWRHAA